jgi:hypothetical protein
VAPVALFQAGTAELGAPHFEKTADGPLRLIPAWPGDASGCLVASDSLFLARLASMAERSGFVRERLDAIRRGGLPVALVRPTEIASVDRRLAAGALDEVGFQIAGAFLIDEERKSGSAHGRGAGAVPDGARGPGGEGRAGREAGLAGEVGGPEGTGGEVAHVERAGAGTQGGAADALGEGADTEARLAYAVVVIDLDYLRRAHALEGGTFQAFLDDVDAILAHELIAHVGSLALSRRYADFCADPDAAALASGAESVQQACSLREENRVRKDLGLPLRSRYDGSGLNLHEGRFPEQVRLEQP